MVHYVRREPERNAFGELRAWCGRYVKPASATHALPETQCLQCREAFAKELRKLPNVFDKE